MQINTSGQLMAGDHDCKTRFIYRGGGPIIEKKTRANYCRARLASRVLPQPSRKYEKTQAVDTGLGSAIVIA